VVWANPSSPLKWLDHLHFHQLQASYGADQAEPAAETAPAIGLGLLSPMPFILFTCGFIFELLTTMSFIQLPPATF
jgi:hypothetical protein